MMYTLHARRNLVPEQNAHLNDFAVVSDADFLTNLIASPDDSSQKAQALVE